MVTYKSLTGLTARGFGLRDGAVPAAHWAHAKEHEFIFFGEAHGATGGVAFRLPDCADAIVSDATQRFCDQVMHVPTLTEASDWAADVYKARVTDEAPVDWPAVGRFVRYSLRRLAIEHLRSADFAVDITASAVREVCVHLIRQSYGGRVVTNEDAALVVCPNGEIFAFENGRGVCVLRSQADEGEAWHGLDAARSLYVEYKAHSR